MVRQLVNSSNPQAIDTAIDPAVYAQIRALHFQTKRLANEALDGDYRSAFKGRGIEFEEVRQYVPGDDVRSIDWKVTARAGQPFIKSFREERELTVVIAVDVSASTRTGTTQISRETLLAQVGATLALIALNNNDKVGLCTYSDKIESYYPPQKGKNSVWRILHEVLSPNKAASDGTDPELLLSFLSSVTKRNAIIFLLSDTFLPNWMLSDVAPAASKEQLLSKFQTLAKRHDVTVVTASDPIDDQLPQCGLLTIRDPESGAVRIIDSRSKSLQRLYKERNDAHRQELKNFLQRARVGQLQLSTARPFIDDINAFFKRRSHLKR